jgi:hypothetical protein
MVRKLNSKNNLRPTLAHPQLYIDFYFYFVLFLLFLKCGELGLFSHEKSFLKVEIIYFWLKNENIVKKNKKNCYTFQAPCPQTTEQPLGGSLVYFRGCVTERNSRGFLHNGVWEISCKVIWTFGCHGREGTREPQAPDLSSQHHSAFPCWPALLPLHVSKLFSTLSFRWQLTLDMSLDGW